MARARLGARRSPTRCELDLSTVVPCIAGPSRPQDRVPLDDGKAAFRAALPSSIPPARRPAGFDQLPLHVRPASPEAASAQSFPASDPPSAGAGASGVGAPDPPAQRPRRGRTADRPRAAVTVDRGGETFTLDHGHVVIAAITSCTNTSNPTVMLAAGLLAQKAVRARPVGEAVGQDVAGARLAGRDGLLRRRRTDRAAGTARLQPRRLRLHHLHRQLGSLADRRGRRRRRRWPGRRLRPLRQPQLRGPHQPRRSHELPDVAAPRRRLRPRRHASTSTSPTSRSARRPTAPTSTCATSGPHATRSTRRVATAVRPDMFTDTYRPCSTATNDGDGSTRRRATASTGSRRRPMCADHRS